MSNHLKWQETKFSEAISINPRESLKKGSIVKKVSMADLQEHTKQIKKYEFEKYKSGPKFRQNDTLFARITPCLENGKISKVNILKEGEIGFGSTEFIIMRAKPNRTDSDFVYYLCRWDGVRETAIKSMTGTSGRQRVQNAVFDELTIHLPPIIEQKAIANILSSLDNKIENNNAIIANLEEQAQVIFKSWFVDFEPFKDREFIDSELGKIPVGWGIATLDEIANYQNGLAMQKYRSVADEESLPVLKIRELRANRIDRNSESCTINIPRNVRVFDGDVIFSWSGSLLVEIWTGGDAGLNQHLFKVTSDMYNKWFYYYWTKYFLEHFVAIAKDRATTMGHIKRSHLKEAKVLIPDKSTMNQMDSLMNPFVLEIINLGKQNKKLQELRDTLLPKLMSGEIRVGDIITEE